MTVSLVTGHAGSNHITSAQIGGFQSKYYGHGIVRLPNLTYNDIIVPGDRTNEADGISWPTVTVSGTTAYIPAGMWLVNGRLVAIDKATGIEIPSHAAGSGAREDILQFRFTVADDGVESVSIAVTEGGNSGLNVAANMLWPNTPQNADIGFAWLDYADSSTQPAITMAGARHVPLDFAYYRNWKMWGGGVEFEQHGSVCTLHFYAVHKSKNDSWYRQVSDARIPTWARPMNERTTYAYTNNGGAPTAWVGVWPDGALVLGNSGNAATTDAMYATLTWVVL